MYLIFSFTHCVPTDVPVCSTSLNVNSGLVLVWPPEVVFWFGP